VSPSSTPLASSQINHDHLKIELIEPDAMPPMVRIVWPPQPTVVDPRRFPDVACSNRATVRTGAHRVRQSESRRPVTRPRSSNSTTLERTGFLILRTCPHRPARRSTQLFEA
jgi:hypothetical protein